MDTKDSILETALRLFNRDGASVVTTRHIAEEMKISPGNLYYHYRNREEIVRVLIQRMTSEFSSMFLPTDGLVDLTSSVNRLMNIPVAVMYRYRFFYMEPVMLLEKDPLLKKIYAKIKKSRGGDFKRLFEMISAAGILIKDISDKDFNAAITNIWALNEFIIQSMYMNNEKITEANIKKSYMRIMYIIKPFISEEFTKVLFPD